MSLPNYLIIGECKCGTTSLYYNLIQHPRIKRAIGNTEDRKTRDGTVLGEKEIRFFDKHYQKGIDWYKACFPEVTCGDITGEASPTYLYRTQTLHRIKKIFGPKGIKLIVCLRNPVDRLISHYSHIREIVNKWSIRYPTFEDYWKSAQEHDYYIIEKGIYVKSLTFLHDLFHWDNIKIIKSEDLFQNTHETCNEIFDFLNIDQAYIRGHHYRKTNLDKTIIDPKILQEIKDFYCHYNTHLKRYTGISWEFN